MAELSAHPTPHPSALREFWYYFSENRGAVIGLWVFVAFIVIAVLAPWLAPYDASEQFRDHILQPPAWQEGGSWAFPLGTDPLGRDMLSRLIMGSRFSFFVGIVVVTVAVSGGVLIGLISGFAPKIVDTLIMRVMDIILAFPSLLLALVLVAILGPSLTNAMLAIAIVLQPHYVRLTRAAVLGELPKDYVTAARVARRGQGSAYGDHGAAKLPCPDHCAGGFVLFFCHSGCGGTWLSGNGGATTHAGMGHDAGGSARIHSARMVGGDLSGCRDPDHCSGDQPYGRRSSGCT